METTERQTHTHTHTHERCWVRPNGGDLRTVVRGTRRGLGLGSGLGSGSGSGSGLGSVAKGGQWDPTRVTSSLSRVVVSKCF